MNHYNNDNDNDSYKDNDNDHNDDNKDTDYSTLMNITIIMTYDKQLGS